MSQIVTFGYHLISKTGLSTECSAHVQTPNSFKFAPTPAHMMQALFPKRIYPSLHWHSSFSSNSENGPHSHLPPTR